MDTDGNVVGASSVGATYYRQDGIEAVIDRLRQGIEACIPAGCEAAACFGMPGFGDNVDSDNGAAAQIAAAFPHIQFRFENDVVVGWGGALALMPGVNIVAGTGSIAYGRDKAGSSFRCGGWHEFFSDEGSGYWFGKQLLRIFSMESDGRLEKTALYDIVRERLNLKDDYDINVLANDSYFHSRKETAALQRLMLEAARQNDPIALDCYRQAAQHLARIVCSTIRKLDFADGVTVSYSGGLFNLDDLIRQPVEDFVKEEMGTEKLHFQAPVLSPCEGGALLAAEAFCPEILDSLRSKLVSKN
jgi:N-acetylglucosamine kinase-like BadF-type ATPase